VEIERTEDKQQMFLGVSEANGLTLRKQDA
jgi:hypothetical protein